MSCKKNGMKRNNNMYFACEGLFGSRWCEQLHLNKMVTPLAFDEILVWYILKGSTVKNASV